MTQHHPTPHRAETAPSAAPHGGDEGDGYGKGAFGAVGDRSAVATTTAFTRGFPQAASADPAWLHAPLGSAGSVDVVFTLNDDGTVAEVTTSGSGNAALTEGVRRTLALLRARSFVADGRITRLRVMAMVTADQVHDGFHGDVFAIGAGDGDAFFALAVGRRVDIHVRQIK